MRSYRWNIALAAALALPFFHAALHAGGGAPLEQESDEVPQREYRESIHQPGGEEGTGERSTLYFAVHGAATVTINSGMDVPDGVRSGIGSLGAGFDLHPAAGVGIVGLLGDTPESCALIGRIMYDDRSSEYRIPAGVERERDRQGNLSMVPMVYWGSATYKLIAADLLLSYPVGGSGLRLLGGPTAGIVIEGRRIESYVPEWAGFAGANFIAEQSDMNPIRVGIKAGVQYELPTASRLRIVPTLLYDFGLNGIWEMDSWKVDALQLGIDLRLPLN